MFQIDLVHHFKVIYNLSQRDNKIKPSIFMAQHKENEYYLTWFEIRERIKCYSIATQQYSPRWWKTNKVTGNKVFSNGLLSTFYNEIAMTNGSIIIKSNNAIADYQPLQLSDKTLPI